MDEIEPGDEGSGRPKAEDAPPLVRKSDVGVAPLLDGGSL